METITQISQSYDSYLDTIINKLEILGNSPVIQEELTAPQDEVNIEDNSFYSRAKQIRRLMLQEYYSVSMYEIEITGNNGANYYVSGHNVAQNFDINELHKMADMSFGHWTIYNSDSLQIIKTIKELQTGKPLGYVRISLRRDYIEKLTKNITVFQMKSQKKWVIYQ